MRRAFCLAWAALVSVVACGGDDGGADGPDAGVDADIDEVEVLAVGECTEPAATITTIGLAYTNREPTIAVGGRVLFLPDGNHDMRSDDEKFDTGALGASACLQFNVAGEYPFTCSMHPGMTGTVTVE